MPDGIGTASLLVNVMCANGHRPNGFALYVKGGSQIPRHVHRFFAPSSLCRPILGEILRNLTPVRRLTGKQERLDELAFAAHNKAGKFPEPLAFRNVRPGIEPARQQEDLFVRDVALAHSRQKMNEQ